MVAQLTMNYINELHQVHKGERVFIIGNGPSLKKTPLEILESEKTIAMNKINLIYPETDWRPTYYMHIHKILRGNRPDFVKENLNNGITCFINSDNYEEIGHHENLYPLDVHYLKKSPKSDSNPFKILTIEEIENMSVNELYDWWSFDLSKKAYAYKSMMVAIEIACYMGFDRIYLVGCDLGYSKTDTHMLFNDSLDPMDFDNPRDFISESMNNNIIKSLINGFLYKFLLMSQTKLDLIESYLFEDSDHFDSSYQSGIKDKRSLNTDQRKAHMLAKRICEDKDIKIYNATLGGELEIYPRVDFSNILEK